MLYQHESKLGQMVERTRHVIDTTDTDTVFAIPTTYACVFVEFSADAQCDSSPHRDAYNPEPDIETGSNHRLVLPVCEGTNSSMPRLNFIWLISPAGTN